MQFVVQPIERRPVIAGVAAKDRARLKTNHCVAAAPVRRLESITGGNKRIGAVTGDAARAPYTAADVAGGSCCYAGRIIYRHSHQPAMKEAAIVLAPISNIKNVAYDGQRRSLRLDPWSESRAVVLSPQFHVHRPARVDVTRVQVKGNDVMFLGRAVIRRRHRVQKERP